MNEQTTNEALDKEIKNILKLYPQEEDRLIMILEEVQSHFGYVPERAQMLVAEYLSIPVARVYGVITFYSRFTLKPKGKYNISICLGTACFVKGSQGILDRAVERLGIEEGDITPDGNFSIETVRCVGACGLAPVFMINKEVYGRSSIKDFDKILDEYVDMIYHENQA
ncbi:MAG: NAD(P)H-dependent oxidoreductase subunit E [Acholeplasmatales bacterium]|nr:NAD(P)H-dependent oxidoreductase subunit E [Acholeplasmatales bacterium]